MDEARAAIEIVETGDGFVTVKGRLYRAVFAHHRDRILLGSDRPGRFTPPGFRTLYTSATAEGTLVALGPYTRPDDPERVILPLDLEAHHICDLRDIAACNALGIEAGQAALPWRDYLERGEEPPSWAITRKLAALGAAGVIDPSRKRPDLFHLALFRWNEDGSPRIMPAK